MSLVNRPSNAGVENKNEAVVLTLRKRYSSLRKAQRPSVISSQVPIGVDASHSPKSSTQNGEDLSANPWTDARTSGGPRLNHRLSFDDASGVIVLPEDERWLMEDIDSDSEEDNGIPAEPSQESEGTQVLPSTSVVTATLPTKARHGTYYHHPEKRKQTIPGAFPRI